MVDDGKWSPVNEEIILQLRDQMLSKFLGDGFDVVVDDTNFSKKHVARIKQIAKNASVDIVDVEAPVDTCIARDAVRMNSVGKDVIMGMYCKYVKINIKPVEHKEGLPLAVVCDMDGTLAKMKNRSPFDWYKVGQDDINPPVERIVKNIGEDVFLLIVSGRDEICRPQTAGWLTSHDIMFDGLFMRPEGNNEDDRIIKRRIYEENIKDKYNVLFVLDDRDKVVRMWRDLGLTCLQVDDGAF